MRREPTGEASAELASLLQDDGKIGGAEPDSDAELMARLGRGETAPLELLFRRYGAMVGSLLRRMVPGMSEADMEDLRQDCFVILFQTAPRYREMGRMRSWLAGIAVREARRWQRKSWGRERLLRLFGPTAVGLSHGRPGRGGEERAEIAWALERLPNAQREVLVLWAVEGLRGDEIALALGVSEKTVWTRLHRARRRLQKATPRGSLGRGTP